MNKREKVKFTVIIPTRERCDVLKSSLKTCTTQDYDNLEIIVSDNFSQDETREVVESFKDSRIRYVNTGKRMNVSDNWEFALSHADGGYVMYVGDDDGLLPGALAELSEVIDLTGCEIVSCQTAGYSWPGYIDESSRNILRVPLRRSLVKRFSKKILTDVINFNRNPQELPALYRSFISYDVIKRAMRESGRFFHSMNPDYYSGIALACVSESYYYSYKPYVISGASHHSAGAAVAFTGGKNSPAFKKFFSENNMPPHSKMVIALSSPIMVAEAFLQAQDHISYAKRFKIDIKKCIKAAMVEVSCTPEKEYETTVEEVKKIAHLNQLDSYASRVVAAYKKPPARFYKPVLGFNIIRGHIVVDCAAFGVQNVYEAAILCKHILVLEKYNHHSVKNIIKTTISLLGREIRNKNLASVFTKVR